MVAGLQVKSGLGTTSVDNRYSGYYCSVRCRPKKLHINEYITAYVPPWMLDNYNRFRDGVFAPCPPHLLEAEADVLSALFTTQHLAAKYYIDVRCTYGDPLAFISATSITGVPVASAILGVNKGATYPPYTHRIYLTFDSTKGTPESELPMVYVFVPVKNSNNTAGTGLRLKNGNTTTFIGERHTLQAMAVATASRPSYPLVTEYKGIVGTSLGGDSESTILKGAIPPKPEDFATHYVTPTPFELVSAQPHIREFWHSMVEYSPETLGNGKERARLKTGWRLGARYDDGQRSNSLSDTPPTRTVFAQNAEVPIAVRTGAGTGQDTFEQWNISNRMVHPRTGVVPGSVPARIAIIDINDYAVIPVDNFSYRQGRGHHARTVVQVGAPVGYSRLSHGAMNEFWRHPSGYSIQNYQSVPNGNPMPAGDTAAFIEARDVINPFRFDEVKRNFIRYIFKECGELTHYYKQAAGYDLANAVTAIFQAVTPTPLPAAYEGWLKGIMDYTGNTMSKAPTANLLEERISTASLALAEDLLAQAGYTAANTIPQITKEELWYYASAANEAKFGEWFSYDFDIADFNGKFSSALGWSAPVFLKDWLS